MKDYGDDLSHSYFTPLRDDAVMYALMGGEADFTRRIKAADPDISDLAYSDEKACLKALFPKNDKPVILIYKTSDDRTDDYETNFKDLRMSDVVVEEINFDEYDKISPLWVDLKNYL